MTVLKNKLTIRKLKKSDLFNGFLELLNSFKKINLDKTTIKKIFEIITSNPHHIIFVAMFDKKLVGTSTLILEQKFIHCGQLVGHIEDVVVSKQHRNKKIGSTLITTLITYAKLNNCYKTVLNCDNSTKLFYERLGFKYDFNCMRYDHI